MTLEVNIFPIPQPQENFYRHMMGNQMFGLWWQGVFVGK